LAHEKSRLKSKEKKWNACPTHATELPAARLVEADALPNHPETKSKKTIDRSSGTASAQLAAESGSQF
jgi:hypothetical protein